MKDGLCAICQRIYPELEGEFKEKFKKKTRKRAEKGKWRGSGYHSSSISSKIMLYFFWGSIILYLINFLGIITTVSGPIEARLLFSKTIFLGSLSFIIPVTFQVYVYNYFFIINNIGFSIDFPIEKFINEKNNY